MIRTGFAHGFAAAAQQGESARKYYATFWRRGFSTVTRLRGHPRSSTFLPSCWIHSYLHSLGLIHAKSFPPPRRQREGYESESQLYAGAGGDLGLLPLAVGARGALGQDAVGRAGGGTRGPAKGVAWRGAGREGERWRRSSCWAGRWGGLGRRAPPSRGCADARRYRSATLFGSTHE